MYRTLSRLTVIRIYVLAVMGWALFGAFAAWALVTGVFVTVSHMEGMPAYTPLAWDGFLTLVCAVGAFIGGASGATAGQERAYEAERKARRVVNAAAREAREAAKPAPRMYRSEAACAADPECEWTCAHLSDRLNGPARGWVECDDPELVTALRALEARREDPFA